MRVLLIEDNEDDVYFIREMLSDKQDVTVESVGRLDNGLLRVNEAKFDLILLDLSLPDSHGLATFTRVQEKAGDRAIIVLTGLDDETLAGQSVRQGAQDYLVKGQLDRRVLFRALRYAVDRKQAENALREREEQLRQAQKMESIGQLAGGVAHDFNNLLTVINSYSDMLLSEIGLEKPFLRNGLDQIKEAGHRAASLTRQLLVFSRRQVLEPKVLDLNEVVTNLAKLLRRLIGEDINLVLCPEPTLGQIQADPGQMEQIIMNLAVNARDAMPGGGQLTIETLNYDRRSSDPHQATSVPPGAYVMLTVSDTGCGMDPTTRARIFEPFFTTKEPGKGTGLGLATVDGIVKQSKGGVTVFSELGKGTTFRIYLPRIEGPIDEIRIAPSPEGNLNGSETILLAEDDEMVRALAQAILERYGYTVVATRNVKDAIRFVEDHSKTFHMLLTDTIMPGMNGPELAGQVLAVRPDIKVLYMSGYTDKVLMNWKPGTPFLQKPFTPQALTKKVRETLSASSANKSVEAA